MIEGYLSPVQSKFLSNSMPRSGMQKQIPEYDNEIRCPSVQEPVIASGSELL